MLRTPNQRTTCARHVFHPCRYTPLVMALMIGAIHCCWNCFRMAYLEAENMVTKGDEGAVKGGRGFEEGMVKG